LWWPKDEFAMVIIFYSVMHFLMRRGAYRFLVKKPEGKKVLGSPKLDGRIILK
jgi:hypothetical protein